jgi:hypothetical protein
MSTTADLPLTTKALALAAIRSAPLRHIGLMPTHASRRRAAAVPIDPSGNITAELEYALDAAQSYWPDCADWTIACADFAGSTNELPPDFVELHDWQPCGQFSY